MSSKWKKRISKFFQGWIGSILLAFIIAMTFKSIIADWNDVPSGSMKPTIVEGDRIFVNKLAYDLKIPFWPFGQRPYKTIQIIRWGEPKRGDIVVFFSPESGIRLVKRVVGLPDDTIEVQNSYLIINGEKLSYEPITQPGFNDLRLDERSSHDFYMETIADKKHAIMISQYKRTDGPPFFKTTIPKNRYVMIGDNRTNSNDSRFWGFVDRRQIVGRAVAIAISRDGSLFEGHFRWHRFFNKLI
jgi:signal peptidase I